jgi:hypothetical protein
VSELARWGFAVCVGVAGWAVGWIAITVLWYLPRLPWLLRSLIARRRRA